MTATATLDQLRPGHEYPGGSINSRKDYPAKDVKDMLASIQTFGVLQSLCVCPAPGKSGPPYYVAAGGRRRLAIEAGIKEKRLPADFAVPVIVRPDWDSTMALAASLAENEEVLAPHPIQVFEQFVELETRGKTREEIAKLFHMELKEVRRILALGALSPKIRKAWLDDEIDADDAKAFTLAKDQKHQDAVFDRLKKQHGMSAYLIRRTLIGDSDDAGRFIKIVGREAYEKAGGKLQEDLFGDEKRADVVVSDMPLLVRLVGEKIADKCAELKAAGWAWAEDADDLPNAWTWDWKKLQAGAKASAEHKAKAGCAVQVAQDGHLEITYGLMKPGERKPAEGKKVAGKKTAAKAPTTISNSLDHDLTVMATRATQDALKNDKSLGGLALLLAGVVASQITPERYNHMPSEIRKSLPHLRDAIPPAVMRDALQKRFDAKRYFPGAPQALVVKAIREALGDEHANKFAKGKKNAAWKFAVANVPKTNWLPPELRTSHYDGPGSKAKAKAKAKPAKKKAR